MNLSHPFASALAPTRSVSAIARTTAFFLKLLPMLPSGPVDWLTRPPLVRKVTYPVRRGTAETDLYLPAAPGPHPGMVISLGVVPFGVDHPQVPRLGQALARAGFAALMHWSPAMQDRRLDPEDVEDIALAYRWLVEQPSIDPGRSGLLGTCVGGSFALMAAGTELIRDRVAFVAAFAPYSSMWTFARDIASGTRSCGDGGNGGDGGDGGDGDRREPWPVDPLTREVYRRSLTAMLDQVSLDGEGGRAGRALLAGADADAAEAALRSLPLELRRRLDALSPLAYVGNLRAPLIVFGHDRDDLVIPVGESRRLRAALSHRTGVHYTEFALFRHADPTKRKLPPLRRLHELGKFYGYVYPMFRLAAS